MCEERALVVQELNENLDNKNEHDEFIGDVKDYVKSDRIGEGTYGLVFRGRNVKTGEIVAIKKVKLDNHEMHVEGFPVTTLREISILKELKHPNIVRLLQIALKGSNIFLIFEYIPMDLRGYMLSLRPVGQRDFSSVDATVHLLRVYRIFYQAVQATLFCHYRRIIHRDLKLQNILIDEKGTVKLADFGLARAFSIPMRQYTQEIVTLWYRAPEILLGTEAYSCAVDVWSLGCIFAELAHGQPLMASDCEIGQLFKIFEMFGTPDDKAWPDMIKHAHFNARFPKFNAIIDEKVKDLRLDEAGEDCLKKMLVCNPKYRIDTKTLLAHECFNRIDKDLLRVKYP